MIAYISCSSKQERVDQGIEAEGSNLSGVSAKCVWDDLSRPPEDEEDSRSICIGSQPRRLSDKGMPKGVNRVDPLINPKMLNQSIHRSSGFMLSAVHDGIIPCWSLFVCWQTQSRSGRPWEKDWSLTARQHYRPSAARDRATRDLSGCSSHTHTNMGLAQHKGCSRITPSAMCNDSQCNRHLNSYQHFS